MPPVASATALRRVLQDLITRARAGDVPIFFVRHLGPSGHPLEQATPGAEIDPDFRPLPEEHVIEKRTPDAFHETGLLRLLEAEHISRPAIAGIQTEFCIDTTCRRAFSLGFRATLIADGHTTWDTDMLTAGQIVAHHNELLGSLFVAIADSTAVQFRRVRCRD